MTLPVEAVVLSVGRKAGAAAVRQMLGQEEQIPALHRKLDILLKGDFYRGNEWLREASRAQDGAEHEQAVEAARERFVDARGSLQEDPLARSAATLKLAQIEEYRGRLDNAREYARMAHDDAVRAVQRSSARLDKMMAIGRLDVINPDTRRGLWISGVGGGVIVLLALAVGILVLLAVGWAYWFIGVVAFWVTMCVLMGAVFLVAQGGSQAAVRLKGQPLFREIEDEDAFVKKLAAYRVQLGEARAAIPEYVIKRTGGAEAEIRYEKTN